MRNAAAGYIDTLLLLEGSFQHITVVYTFTSRHTLSKLKAAGIHTLKGPATNDSLLANLDAAEPSVTPAQTPPNRFSKEELARIAALSPGLNCECPNHIAQLLMEITSFERYSLECSSADPKDQALHQHLGQISAQARTLFENALIAVATADGIQLSVDN